MKMINLFMIYILFFPVAVFAQKRDSIAMRGVIDTVDVIENRLYNAQDANAGSPSQPSAKDAKVIPS